MIDNEYKEIFIVLDNIIYTCKLHINSNNVPRLEEFIIDVHTGEMLYSYIDVKYSLYTDDEESSVYLGALIDFIKIVNLSYDRLKEEFICENIIHIPYIQYLYHHFYAQFKTIFKHDLEEDDLWG